jgi:hypothetical protein
MRAKRDKSVIVGISVILGVLSLGLMPAAFAAPPQPDTSVQDAPPLDGGSWCYTYDSQLTLLRGTFAAAQHYVALGAAGGVAESQDGTPGPKALASEKETEALILSLKDAAIARGDSCLGDFHDGTDGEANDNIPGSVPAAPSK